MAAALALQALKEGGLPSGAVLVEQGVVLGKGRNRCLQTANPTALAEIECLRHLGPGARPAQACLYLTLSPCPLGVSAILQRDIAQVVVADATYFAEGLTHLRSMGVAAVMRPESLARSLMRHFKAEQPLLWETFLSSQERLRLACAAGRYSATGKLAAS